MISAGMIKDLAAVQRGNPALKLWTNFYSFFSATWNLHAESVARTDFKKPVSIGRLGADLLLLSVVPAAMSMALRNALRGNDDPDDWTWNELLHQELAWLAGMLVGFRELAGVLQGYHDYEGPAGGRIFSEAGKLIQQVEQGEFDRALWRSLNQSAGVLFHYPAAQVQRSVEGFIAWQENKAPISALVFGPSLKR